MSPNLSERHHEHMKMESSVRELRFPPARVGALPPGITFAAGSREGSIGTASCVKGTASCSLQPLSAYARPRTLAPVTLAPGSPASSPSPRRSLLPFPLRAIRSSTSAACTSTPATRLEPAIITIPAPACEQLDAPKPHRTSVRLSRAFTISARAPPPPSPPIVTSSSASSSRPAAAPRTPSPTASPRLPPRTPVPTDADDFATDLSSFTSTSNSSTSLAALLSPPPQFAFGFPLAGVPSDVEDGDKGENGDVWEEVELEEMEVEAELACADEEEREDGFDEVPLPPPPPCALLHPLRTRRHRLAQDPLLTQRAAPLPAPQPQEARIVQILLQILRTRLDSTSMALYADHRPHARPMGSATVLPPRRKQRKLPVADVQVQQLFTVVRHPPATPSVLAWVSLDMFSTSFSPVPMSPAMPSGQWEAYPSSPPPAPTLRPVGVASTSRSEALYVAYTTQRSPRRPPARLERVERERVVLAVSGCQQQQRLLRFGVCPERVREHDEWGERGAEEEADPDRNVFAVSRFWSAHHIALASPVPLVFYALHARHVCTTILSIVHPTLTLLLAHLIHGCRAGSRFPCEAREYHVMLRRRLVGTRQGGSGR
ncbi:hypothetical protein DFH08DRAFT_1083715 [Mycena albidolilacea]|uniref:Uncharacterized protein n=1 Tax=Mycena albidolilacea TaxID=1033008 RepID=A0AAD6ZPX1_9AGAR|nr:hypothetical protein DFH08DRAFT_1083715 [Mycena albidolilacea]